MCWLCRSLRLFWDFLVVDYGNEEEVRVLIYFSGLCTYSTISLYELTISRDILEGNCLSFTYSKYNLIVKSETKRINLHKNSHILIQRINKKSSLPFLKDVYITAHCSANTEYVLANQQAYTTTVVLWLFQDWYGIWTFVLGLSLRSSSKATVMYGNCTKWNPLLWSNEQSINV